MNMNAVSKRISDARKAKHLTQEELAALADISPTHVGVIERSAKVPSLATFVNIANALGVSADSLLQDVVTMSFESEISELSKLISKQPPDVQRRIYRAVKVLVGE